MSSVRDLLPQLVPLAVEWAERVSSDGAAAGRELDEAGLRIARGVGVSRPGQVRIATPDAMPFPDHPMLREAAIRTGMLGPTMAGLTLGYTIFVRPGALTVRLLSHELRHVAQYEAAGSIAAFLSAYLGQVVHFGYGDAPYEVDARSHEVGGGA
jgi:hypothetical protein